MICVRLLNDLLILVELLGIQAELVPLLDQARNLILNLAQL